MLEYYRLTAPTLRAAMGAIDGSGRTERSGSSARR
jgi:hypothetical protein